MRNAAFFLVMVKTWSLETIYYKYSLAKEKQIGKVKQLTIMQQLTSYRHSIATGVNISLAEGRVPSATYVTISLVPLIDNSGASAPNSEVGD